MPTPAITTYDHATVKVDRDLESLYQDTYRAFGWQVEGRDDPSGADAWRPLHSRFARNVPLVGWFYRQAEGARPAARLVLLRLRRDRSIANRKRVDELQHQALGALGDIDHLERSVSSRATATSSVLGVVGAALLAGAVFSITAAPLLMVVLGALGLIAWAGAAVSHVVVRRRRRAAIEPLLQERYDVVHEAAGEAVTLLG